MALLENKKIGSLYSNVNTRVQEKESAVINETHASETLPNTDNRSIVEQNRSIFRQFLAEFKELRDRYMPIGALQKQVDKNDGEEKIVLNDYAPRKSDLEKPKKSEDRRRMEERGHPSLRNVSSINSIDYFGDVDSCSEETISRMTSGQTWCPELLKQYLLRNRVVKRIFPIRFAPEKPKIYSIGLNPGTKVKNGEAEGSSETCRIYSSTNLRRYVSYSFSPSWTDKNFHSNRQEFVCVCRKRNVSVQCSEDFFNNDFIKFEKRDRHQQRRETKVKKSRSKIHYKKLEWKRAGNGEVDARRKLDEFLRDNIENEGYEEEINYSISAKAHGGGDSASSVILKAIDTNSSKYLEWKISESQIMENVKRRIDRDINHHEFNEESETEEIPEVHRASRDPVNIDEKYSLRIDNALERRNYRHKKYHFYNQENIINVNEMEARYSYPILKHKTRTKMEKETKKILRLPSLYKAAKISESSMTYGTERSSKPNDKLGKEKNESFCMSPSSSLNYFLSESRQEDSLEREQFYNVDYLDPGVLTDSSRAEYESANNFYDKLGDDLEIINSRAISSSKSCDDNTSAFDFAMDDDFHSDESIDRKINIAVEELTESLILYERRFNDRQKNECARKINSHDRTKQWLSEVETYNTTLITPSLSFISDSEAEVNSQKNAAVIREMTSTS